jgi:3-hydroxy-9,10-secoandrosta-1,3,5(10)-triene-9,17-dione monooxygenase
MARAPARKSRPTGRPVPSTDELVELARDRAFIAKLCVGAVTRLVRQMGAMGLSDDNPVQRHYRDQLVMASQIGANWDHHGTAFGRHAFGLPLAGPAGGPGAALVKGSGPT